MEKVNEITSSPMDVLLLPVWVHKRLSVKLRGLIFAFLFVGIFDMVFYQNLIKEGIFHGDMISLVFKFLLLIVFSFIIGAVDVIFTMVPIAEFAMVIGKRSEKHVSGGIIAILMKSYALSHFLYIIPNALFVYSGVDWNIVDAASPHEVRWLFSILLVIINFMPYFQLGIIYRTISIRTRIQAFGKLILIMALYFWMRISGDAIIFIESLLFRLL